MFLVFFSFFLFFFSLFAFLFSFVCFFFEVFFSFFSFSSFFGYCVGIWKCTAESTMQKVSDVFDRWRGGGGWHSTAGTQPVAKIRGCGLSQIPLNSSLHYLQKRETVTFKYKHGSCFFSLRWVVSFSDRVGLLLFGFSFLLRLFLWLNGCCYRSEREGKRWKEKEMERKREVERIDGKEERNGGKRENGGRERTRNDEKSKLGAERKGETEIKKSRNQEKDGRN